MMATSPFNLARPDTVATPFLSNNGNPNTVYNTAATPMQSFGNQPLMHNAAAVGAILPQPWASTPVFNPGIAPLAPVAQLQPESAFAAPAAQFWRNLSGAQRPVFDLSTSGVTNPNQNWVPATPPTTTPPATTPPTTTPPGPGGGTVPSDEVPNRPDSDGAGTGTLIPFTTFKPTTTSTSTKPDGKPVFVDGQGNEIRGNTFESIRNGLEDIVNSASRGLGFNGRDGQFDVNQFIDAITQVVMPGDLYNANVGKWNGLNVATAVLNSFMPGLGNLGAWLVDKLPEGNALRSWLQRNVLQNNVDDAIENINDAPQTRPDEQLAQGWGGENWNEAGGGGGGSIQLIGNPFGGGGDAPVRWGDVGTVTQIS